MILLFPPRLVRRLRATRRTVIRRPDTRHPDIRRPAIRLRDTLPTLIPVIRRPAIRHSHTQRRAIQPQATRNRAIPRLIQVTRRPPIRHPMLRHSMLRRRQIPKHHSFTWREATLCRPNRGNNHVILRWCRRARARWSTARRQRLISPKRHIHGRSAGVPGRHISLQGRDLQSAPPSGPRRKRDYRCTPCSFPR